MKPIDKMNVKELKEALIAPAGRYSQSEHMAIFKRFANMRKK